ncbi:MAG: L-glutamate gamma-semialdehyde dehydrogenase [Phycisphaerae bacterium]
MLTPFVPEPYVDFTQDQPRRRMLAALKAVGDQLGQRYSLWINGEPVTTSNWINSISPGATDRVVGQVAKAGAQQADQAIRLAADRFKFWSGVHPEERALVLAKAAAIMRQRIYELSAWQCYEVSKPWSEAYADVCEAIDFCEFYAREMIQLQGRHSTTPFPGEDNAVRYIPLGVVGIISPWNFPLAICMGMTVAALVAGNTVVLKPSSDAPVIAAKMYDILAQAGLPPGVLNFVPGSGGDVGATIVDHPLTRMIAFTGSRDVGAGINERAAKVHQGQIWIKRVILEMGGKNGILVDETADLAAAADAVVASAFGLQGQKCSACSRLVAHADVYDDLLQRVVQRSRKLTIGDTVAGENYTMGGVINQAAYDSINDYIKVGKGEGRLILGETKTPSGGYFIPPTVIADVDPHARIAQEEIFGPVLAVIKARDFDDGLRIINDTPYGLTGALFSTHRQRLHRAGSEFHVGNLYLNRQCTGALVGVQPFGGFNMSGTNSKAGGPDYIPLFLQAKSITERL